MSWKAIPNRNMARSYPPRRYRGGAAGLELLGFEHERAALVAVDAAGRAAAVAVRERDGALELVVVGVVRRRDVEQPAKVEHERLRGGELGVPGSTATPRQRSMKASTSLLAAGFTTTRKARPAPPYMTDRAGCIRSRPSARQTAAGALPRLWRGRRHHRLQCPGTSACALFAFRRISRRWKSGTT